MPFPYRTFRDWLAEEEDAGYVQRIRTPLKAGDYKHLVEVPFQKWNPGVPDPRGLFKAMQPETEIRAAARYLHTLPGKPTGIIENPIDNRPDIPVVINPWPNLDRVLRGLGCKDKQEWMTKAGSLGEHRIKPNIITRAQAPCKEMVIREKELDLRKDIPRVWVEFNKLCFTGCNGTIISYDPGKKTHGLTKTRLAVFDWDNGDPKQAFSEDKQRYYGFTTMARPGRPGQGNTGRYYFENYRNKGKSWPAVFVYGLPTDYHVLAAVKGIRWPEMGDEYEIMGGFRGQPVDLVESETIPGLMVPADAEWVIEGEFVNEDYTTPEFSEDLGLGFIWGKAIWPVFRAKCITRRRDAIWDATTFSSLGSKDFEGVHIGLLAAANAGMVPILRKMGYKVKDIVTPSYMNAIVQLEVDGADKPRKDYALEIGKLIMAKFTIVVGPDIDPNNLEAVVWAMGVRGARNTWFDYPKAPPGAPEVPKYGFFNDLTMDMGYTIIDATIPVPERFDTYPPRTEPPAWEEEAVARMRAKLGHVGRS
jgi:3-polyprenyl-4-hydroxybenzoate decarboxylase